MYNGRILFYVTSSVKFLSQNLSNLVAPFLNFPALSFMIK